MNDPIEPLLCGLLPETGEPVPYETLRVLVMLRRDFEYRVQAWMTRARHAKNPTLQALTTAIAHRIEAYILKRLHDAHRRWMHHHPVGQAYPPQTGIGIRPLTDLYAFTGDPAHYSNASQLWKQLRIAPQMSRAPYLRAYSTLYRTINAPTGVYDRYAQRYKQAKREQVTQTRIALGSTNPRNDYLWYHDTDYERWCHEHTRQPNLWNSWKEYCEHRPEWKQHHSPVYYERVLNAMAIRATARLFTAHAHEIARFLAHLPVNPPYALRTGHYIAPTEFGWRIPPHEAERWHNRWSQTT